MASSCVRLCAESALGAPHPPSSPPADSLPRQVPQLRGQRLPLDAGQAAWVPWSSRRHVCAKGPLPLGRRQGYGWSLLCRPAGTWADTSGSLASAAQMAECWLQWREKGVARGGMCPPAPQCPSGSPRGRTSRRGGHVWDVEMLCPPVPWSQPAQLCGGWAGEGQCHPSCPLPWKLPVWTPPGECPLGFRRAVLPLRSLCYRVETRPAHVRPRLQTTFPGHEAGSEGLRAGAGKTRAAVTHLRLSNGRQVRRHRRTNCPPSR